MRRTVHTFPVVLLAALAVVVAGPGTAAAHDLRLVVKLPPEKPTELYVEAGFDDEMPAEGGKVVITDAAGKVVVEGTTDETGVCRLERPGPGKYTATVTAIGHQDVVEFEVVGTTEQQQDAATEYRGWRPDRTLGLAVGVFGLLAVSAAFWWFRRNPSGRS